MPYYITEMLHEGGGTEVRISNFPAVDKDGNECLEGRVRESRSMIYNAHGGYWNLWEAKDAVKNIFGKVEKIGESMLSGLHTIEYKVYEKLEGEYLYSWIGYGLNEIEATTTDEELLEISEEWEEEANAQGYTLVNLYDILEMDRDSKKEELDNWG